MEIEMEIEIEIEIEIERRGVWAAEGAQTPLLDLNLSLDLSAYPNCC